MAQPSFTTLPRDQDLEAIGLWFLSATNTIKADLDFTAWEQRAFFVSTVLQAKPSGVCSRG
jgi:hypothetical protein